MYNYIQTGHGRVRIVNRKGEFLAHALHWLGGKVAQAPTVYCNPANVYGDPGSLSDARLNTHKVLVYGEQSLDILSKHNAFTDDQEDLDQRRLGLIADKVLGAL